MIKRIKERSLHFIIIAFLTGIFLGMSFSFIASADEPAHKYLDYFHRVYQIIRTQYVEVPNNKGMFFGAIEGMIKSLDDPFSRFLDERSFSELREMTTGKFVGVGIVITMKDNEVVVISPIEDSPAMRSGIKTDDVIVKVNDKDIRGMKLSAVVKMIKGMPKSKVKLYIRRIGDDELIKFEIERAPIKIKSVNYSILKKHNVGYIKIKNFGSDTSRDLTEAVKYLNTKKIKKLIVDLRYNPGGLLSTSVKTCDLFLKKGKVIVSTRGRKGVDKVRYYRSKNKPLYKGKLLVLVNKGSASASEIFAGAMRDNKRGKLIGLKTFGKGSVQKSFTLGKKVGVAITIARYYTPSGEMIHKKGIEPDYKVRSDLINKKDNRNIQKLKKLRLLKKFLKKGMIYNKELKKKFQKFLRKNKIRLSSKVASYILKNRINRYKKRSVYDLEFDKQLVSALHIIKKMK